LEAEDCQDVLGLATADDEETVNGCFELRPAPGDCEAATLLVV